MTSESTHKRRTETVDAADVKPGDVHRDMIGNRYIVLDVNETTIFRFDLEFLGYELDGSVRYEMSGTRVYEVERHGEFENDLRAKVVD